MTEEKKIKGRKRHIITDTQGLVLGCYIGPADENDRSGIFKVLEKVTISYKHILKMWADMGYQGKDVSLEIKEKFNLALEIVKRPNRSFWIQEGTPQKEWPQAEVGFKIQPRRWVVERTFGWLNRSRKLTKEYDLLPQSTENTIYIAMSRLILYRFNRF